LHPHLSIQDQKIRKTFHPEDTREGEKAEYIVGGQEGGCWSTEFEDCLPLNRGRRHQTNGAGSIPALGLIPKLASHICYELGSTGIQLWESKRSTTYPHTNPNVWPVPKSNCHSDSKKQLEFREQGWMDSNICGGIFCLQRHSRPVDKCSAAFRRDFYSEAFDCCLSKPASF